MLYEIVGLVVVAGVAAFFLVPMFRDSRRQGGQKQWPRVRAEVLEHRIRESGNSGFEEYRVRYTYGGEHHDRFVGSPDKLGVTLTKAGSHVNIRQVLQQRMARRRPVGSTTEIMINPANSAEVYVPDRELPVRALAYGIGAIFLILFLMFAVVTFDLI